MASETPGVIVCAHGGDPAEGLATLRVAASLAAAYGDLLVLVMGYDPPLVGGEVGDLRRAAAEVAEGILAEAVAEVGRLHPGLAVESVLVEDRPTESVLFVADQRSARAIVVGHGGEGPMRGALLGSVTYNLVHRSPVPVMVVPPVDEV